ncbi:lipocalin family protein [Bergeyella zoohelcum]|uniref:Lipocalin-like domain-containing protein n=1 Tax=Bergeyella zoohelcum TaxID=1015 RepID=A0A380ZT49_9FLAO|nr:lipocalin family protein [Bergeyella zoohelcum]EKB60637.1 hypothetical protein HMPREF9700_00132 [Bergeyella zoohelcum CCUG 30536]SUV52185.1 Uncharacterised protein [Bergeyella zoohelcum]
MKKLLLSTLVAISFVACDRDRAESVNQETLPSLVGTWKFSEFRVYDGNTDKILQSEGVDDCSVKSRIFFLNDGNVVAHTYSQNLQGECEDLGEEKSTYKYNASAKTITINDGKKIQTKNVIKLTNNEFEVVTGSEYDFNHDGVNDREATLLVRVK